MFLCLIVKNNNLRAPLFVKKWNNVLQKAIKNSKLIFIANKQHVLFIQSIKQVKTMETIYYV